VSLSVRDPNGFVVAATSASSDAFGAVGWSVPTSQEPVLGQWSITATATSSAGNATAERAFELARYLLPTFSVAVTPSAPYLTYTRDRNGDDTVTIAGSLAATHTNGAPVAGTVMLSVLQPMPSYYGNPIWGRPMGNMAVDPAAADVVDKRPASTGAATSGSAAGALPTVPIVASSDGDGGGGATSATLLGTLALATSAAGSASFSLKVPSAGLSWDGAPLMLLAAVTETATGEAQNGTARVAVASAPVAAALTADADFKPGLPWRVTLALTLPDGTPAGALAAPRAALAATAQRRSGTPALSLTAAVTPDAAGLASTSFTVPADDVPCCNRTAGQEWQASQTSCCVDYISVSLSGVADVSAYAGASVRFGAAAGAFAAIGPVSPSGAIAPGGSVAFTPAATSSSAPLRWALLGPKGAVAAGSATPGVAVTLTVPASAGAAPSLLLWYQAQGGSLALDFVTLSVVASLPQSLSASFGAATAQPGDNVTVSAAGAPSCRVYFAATDVSIALLGADAALTAAGVTAAAADALQAAADAADAAATAAGASVGTCYNPPPHQAAGAALLTSISLPACENTWFGGGGIMAMGAVADMAMPEAAKVSAPSDMAARSASSGDGGGGVRVRSQFPETWLWATADADGSGAASLRSTAPDTLTSWQLAAFSVHPTLGLAVAPAPALLSVSQPFYLRAAPPLAMVRGEQVLLRVGLFSNMSVAVNATVTLLDATGSGFDLAGGASASATLPAGGAAGVVFAITPTRFGALTLRMTGEARDAAGSLAGADALLAPLTVIAEGIPAEITQNALLRLGGAGTTAADAAAVLSAPAPANAVEGSARSTLSVIGDLMGQTLAGLGALLQVPSGCGEQNMIGMAPNVAVLEYLAAVPGASPPPALAAAAAANAATGFQRELTYRHSDGSFSAFGESDASGSTWLTAFVLKVFSDAARFVAIDDAVLASAATWLLAQQDTSSGIFRSVGSVIHTDMVGGVSSDVSMTGFVLAALLAAPASAGVDSRPLNAAAGYLAAHPAASGDAYAAHVRAYALAAACSARQLRCSDAATAATGIKAALVSTAGALRHWEAPRTVASGDASYWQAPPADIELTGYGVLTMLAQGRAADATDPARWLVAQRGSGGGFGSTQDTVVGLAALSRFAAATYGAPPAMSLAVRGAGVADGTSVVVDAARASLLQQLDMPPGAAISVAGTGAGTALVQLTTRYNVLPAAVTAGTGSSGGSGFAVSVSAVNVTGDALRRRRLLGADDDVAPSSLVHVKVCAQRGAAASAARQAGMVILEAGLFSGYAPVAASLAAVQASAPALVKRVEVDLPSRRVLFYLDALPSGDPVCLQFDTLQASPVFGLAPAASRAYSYYAPADSGAAALAVEAVGAATARPPSGASGPPALLGGPGLPGGRSPSGAARAATAAVWVSAVAAGVCLLSCAGFDLGLPKMHTG
jgi:CD109 antigen